MPPDDLPGEVLPSRYRDPVRIAVGGMGTVYRAHDERLGRTVAVKVQSPAFAGDEAHRRRFRREATSAARIDHPHVATIYDVGEHRGQPYLVMELVPGGTLEQWMARGRAPRAQAIDWIAQSAAALDAAHAAGVVHRDVKPANLLLDAEGRVKVADFGIARVLEDSGATLTAAGTVLGTSGYASPEQAQGMPASPRSDVYSLAAVAFELLTGERPYAGRTGIAELTAHVREPVPVASQRAPDLSPRVDAALARGLAKDPADRYATAGALADSLRAAVAPPPAVRRTGSRRPRALAAVLALLVVGGVSAVAVIATTGGDGPGGPPAADRVAPPAGATAPPIVTETVTSEAPATPSVAPPADPVDAPVEEEPLSVEDAVALTDESTAALAGGDSTTGLALAVRALVALAGTGEPYEGNARYNSGRALIDLGRCDEALPQLERSVEVGGTDWQLDVRRAALREAGDC